MQELTQAQSELYQWIKNFVEQYEHFPTIRAMMRAMNLRSPAPIQSRLEILIRKGWIEKQEDGKMKLILDMPGKSIYIRGCIIKSLEKQIQDEHTLTSFINELLLQKLAEI